MVTRAKSLLALPPFAQQFLQANASSFSAVQRFHRWLKSTHRPILQLDAQEIETFLGELSASSLPQSTRSRRRRLVLRYLDWLHSQNLLRFDPRRAWPRSNCPLPPPALRFVDSLKPTHKPSTVRGYQTQLRQFHIWLDAEHITLEHLERRHIEAWLGWLHARGLHPSSRLAIIQNIRAYFAWLEEQKLLTTPESHTLLRSSDLPKLPQYLPRPLPADVDAQLQLRLRKSRDVYQLGLLLMRRTGLRIGELIALPYDCLRHDLKGNPALLVPLGKLDTERLVPLDPQTEKLVLKLRRRAKRKHHWLLQSIKGRKTRYDLYRAALLKASRGLHLSEPITTHRLRHTYATSLLAAGMNLPSVMRLLGHRDYRMTLRYAAVTDETVRIEYTAALANSETRYQHRPAPLARKTPSSSPATSLTDAVRYLRSLLSDHSVPVPEARALIARIRRLDASFRKLLRKITR